jgi:cyclophilin family peptidyl-prolyl cis-trans isomerase
MRSLALVIALAFAVSCGSTAAAPTSTPVRLVTAAPTTAAPRGVPAPPAGSACVVKPITFVKAPSKATITLEKGGTITIALRPDKAPKTVTNFANVANSGCYDGLTFHRVELQPPFVIQGGDPLGNGSGGGTQPAEYNDLPFVKGAVGIARGQDKAINNSFQFFVCIGQCLFLNNEYTNFGLVTDGQSIADAVRVGDKIKTIVVE